MLDSAQPHHSHPPAWEKPRRRFRLGLAIIMLLLLAGGIFIGSKIVTFAEKILEGPDNRLSLRDFFMGADRKLQGEDDGQIRILLMGIGGAGHDGGTLTDTMILATLTLSPEPQATLVSIPRDLVVEIAGSNEYRKINSAYALGEIGEKKRGAAMAVATVEKFLDMDIPYYAVVDFQGFEKIIDDLGGIEITVDQAFADSYFPDENKGYLPPVSFEAGRQGMDGPRALQFVRSRHGDSGEGSDFARARRQQKVLRAVKDKAVSFRVATNLGLLSRLMNDLSDHLRTNLQPFELKRLYDLARGLKSDNILSMAIDNTTGLVCDQIEKETGAYNLIPCQGLGQYEAIRNFVKNQAAIANLETESAAIEIQNTSKIDFLGQKVKERLLIRNLSIAAANFRGSAEFSESIIYDNTRGAKPKTLKYLQDTLGIATAISPFPFATSTKQPDFVIVVTADLNK